MTLKWLFPNSLNLLLSPSLFPPSRSLLSLRKIWGWFNLFFPHNLQWLFIIYVWPFKCDLYNEVFDLHWFWLPDKNQFVFHWIKFLELSHLKRKSTYWKDDLHHQTHQIFIFEESLDPSLILLDQCPSVVLVTLHVHLQKKKLSLKMKFFEISTTMSQEHLSAERFFFICGPKNMLFWFEHPVSSTLSQTLCKKMFRLAKSLVRPFSHRGEISEQCLSILENFFGIENRSNGQLCHHLLHFPLCVLDITGRFKSRWSGMWSWWSRWWWWRGHQSIYSWFAIPLTFPRSWFRCLWHLCKHWSVCWAGTTLRKWKMKKSKIVLAWQQLQSQLVPKYRRK